MKWKEDVIRRQVELVRCAVRLPLVWTLHRALAPLRFPYYDSSSAFCDLMMQAEAYLDAAMKKIRGGRSDVEDRFFKLDEMEKFLDQEDASEQRRRLRKEKGLDSGDDDDEHLDFFEDTSPNEHDERAKYTDYFGHEAEDQPSEGDEDLGEMKSSHEEAQIRLKKKIKRLEEEAISEKPWQLRGEIAGPARPDNSLLQEHLDYDTVARQAPIITEEVSKRLEDIILRRIKDRAWDDVERKVKPINDPYEYKKKLVLDAEKSKLSLAQIYEQEYLNQQSKAEQNSKLPSVFDR